MTIEPAALKLADAALYLGVSEVSIRRLIQKGRLKRHPAFRHILIRKEALDKFLSEAN